MKQLTQLTPRQNVILNMSNLADEIFEGCQVNNYEKTVLWETADYFLRVATQFHFHKQDIKLKIDVCKRYMEASPNLDVGSDTITQLAGYETELVMIKDLLEKLSTYVVRLAANPRLH